MFAQGHKTVPLVMLKHVTPQSITEPMPVFFLCFRGMVAGPFKRGN